jgi:hypothetical protein
MDLTCKDCQNKDTWAQRLTACPFAFDWYNTFGDCLMEKTKETQNEELQRAPKSC